MIAQTDFGKGGKIKATSGGTIRKEACTKCSGLVVTLLWWCVQVALSHQMTALLRPASLARVCLFFAAVASYVTWYAILCVCAHFMQAFTHTNSLDSPIYMLTMSSCSKLDKF